MGTRMLDLKSWLSMLEAIAENSTNMVVVTDARKRVTWVNKTYTRITGWTLEECQGKPPGAYLHGPLTNPVSLNRLRTLLRQGQSVSDIELVNYRKSGETYTVQLNIEPIRDAGGEIVAYLSIQSDISERKRLEAESLQLRRHLEVAQRLARLGRIEHDLVASRCKWSSQVYLLLEMPQDSQSRGIGEFFAHVLEADRCALGEALKHSMQSGEEFDLELRLVTTTGKVRWARCRGMPEWHDGQYRQPSTWSIQDVSVYKELIEERRRKNEELNVLVNARTRKLEEARRSMEEFTYALSHDLRKPIRHMVSFTQLLQESIEQLDAPEVAKYCERIVEAGRNAQALIHSMLSLATLGRAGVNPVHVELGPMIRGVIEELTQEEGVHHIEWRVPERWPDIRADEVLLRDVWTNLIDNSIKYSRHRAQPVIEIGSTTHAGTCVLYIKDNGCGFEPRDADKIFGLFQRTHAGSAVEGSGIGLAQVRRVVENHGWHISAHGQPGAGAEFRIHIPPASNPDMGELSATSVQTANAPAQMSRYATASGADDGGGG